MTSPPIKIIDSSTAYKGNYITVAEETVELPSGKQLIRGCVKHKGAVVIIPYLDENTFLLVRQYRVPIRAWLLEFPAGTLEVGEPPLECAKRELIEETGYEAKTWISIGIQYPAPGFCDEVQHIFVAKDLSPKTAEKDEDEIIEVVAVGVGEFKGMVRLGEIADAKTVCVWARMQAKISLNN
jgi:ADP-ribose pyrophosphatase